jgi:hypothetical protein
VVFGAILLAGALLIVAAFIHSMRLQSERRSTSISDRNQTTAPSPSISSTPTSKQWTPAERLAKAEDMWDDGKGSSSESDLSAIVEHLKAIPSDARESKQAKAIRTKAEARLAKINRDRTLIGPKPDDRGWKGKVFCVDRYLKANLNDYESAEYLEWSPVTSIEVKGEPYWAVRLKLRAANGFGAKILKEPIFLIRQNAVVRVEGL